MNRSNRSRLARLSRLNPFARKSKKTAHLAAVAGERPEMWEQLEQRQMLFTLTVGPNGTAAADFGYVIPYLIPTVQIPNAGPTVTLEDFNSNDPADPGPTPNGIPIPEAQAGATGYVFDQSNLKLEFDDQSLTRHSLVREVLANAGANRLEFQMQQGERFAFAVAFGIQAPARDNFLRFTTPSPFPGTVAGIRLDSNLDVTNMVVELTLRDANGNDVVVRQLTGAQLLDPAISIALPGGGRQFTFQNPGGSFDHVRFVSQNGSTPTFWVDNVRYAVPAGNFGALIDQRIFLAQLRVNNAPPGATIEVRDLYGRDMVLTTALGIPFGSLFQITIVDSDDDGIPNFNDGIGSITVRGFDGNSNLSLDGGTIIATAAGFLPVPANGASLFDAFEQAGFGFALRAANTVQGLPEGPGSVIVGSPWVRPLNGYSPRFIATSVSDTNFNRADEGIFELDGGSINRVNVIGIVMGSSRLNGFANTFSAGYMLGSLSVAGDLGSFSSGTDAGEWGLDTANLGGNTTNASLIVGRTLDSFAVAGRSAMNITVIGDLNSPVTRPARNRAGVLYVERESAVPAIFFGSGRIGNDTILSAEWVGSIATAVEIVGGPANGGPSDVYAFAVAADQDLVIQMVGGAGNPATPYLRLMDVDGRTLAANEQANPIGSNPDFTGIRYRPTQPGVLYLDVMTGATAYRILITGLASTTFGEFRVGAGIDNPGNIQVLSGSMGSIRVGTTWIDTTVDGRPEVDPAAIYNEPNGPGAPTTLQQLSISSQTTFTLPGRLYNFTAGGNVAGIAGVPGSGLRLNVGRDLGSIVTGISAVAGGPSPRIGDFRNSILNIGGSIGMMDIRGALGINQSVPPAPNGFPVDTNNSIVILTGTNISVDPSLRGNIGFIRVGSDAGEGTLSVTTPNNSFVGGFVVDQDLGVAPGDPYTGVYSNDPITSTITGLGFHLGFNSDLRFFDTPQMDLAGVNDNFIELRGGEENAITLTDDGGAMVQLILRNSTTPARVIVMPIAGSLGVAIARIEADLSGGATLEITGITNPNGHQVTIGNLVITNADAGSNIVISGAAEVDVWRITQRGGTEFGGISNLTPFGDIVAADMQALNALEMGTGDLGRSFMPAWGPQQIGPFLGITNQGTNAAAGSPITIPPAVLASLWSGDLFRPVNDARDIPLHNPWLDDLGSPVNPYLNGLIVRTGNVTRVVGRGSIGDVILNDTQGGFGILGDPANPNDPAVVANADGVTPSGRFDGLIGVIFATRIGPVDVGQGLIQKTQSPMATSGIFAIDDIAAVRAHPDISGKPAFISSIIDAANLVPNNTDGQFATDGIDTIDIQGSTILFGGNIVDAYIGAMKLDSWWRGRFTAFDVDPAQYRGNIKHITGTNANLLRSQVWATLIGWGDAAQTQEGAGISLVNGFYDATLTHAAQNIRLISAAGFRNSTVSGNQTEFFPNQIITGGNLITLTTSPTTGDMEDLVVDVTGRITTVTANTFTRSNIGAAIEIGSFLANTDLRSSTITTGHLTTATIKRNVRSSEISVAGLLDQFLVEGEVTTSNFSVTGPDGQLNLLRVANGFTGSISVAGLTGTIEVTNGDLNAVLVTARNLHGNPGDINTIRAGRDIILDADISGTITQLIAGRNIGSAAQAKPIVVHGDINTIDISHGQLYSDIRVDQRLVTSLTIGAVNNKPGSAGIGFGSLIAFGHIALVTINGDFGGSIISWSGGIDTININEGSLLPSASIAAHDGDLIHLNINHGHLMGSVHAGRILWDITVTASADGVFGDLGINPALSQGNASGDPLRNQLPPGVVPDTTLQGPRITAGFNIGRITLTNGSIFEAFIYAGRAIGTITVAGDIRNDTLTSGIGTVIAAGASMFAINVTGNISNTLFLGGVKSFGADNAIGGTGANADTILSSRIETITAAGSGTNVAVSVGMDAGADGIYNSGDENVVLGVSYVRTVTFGAGVSNVTVYADSPTLNVSPGVVRAGTAFPLGDADLSDGSSTNLQIPSDGTPFVFTLGSVSGNIVFHGPGQAFFDVGARRVILLHTTLASTLAVTANGALADFDIVTNDDASMNSITVSAPLTGDSDIAVDGYCLSIATTDFSGTGSIKVGMNVRSIATGNFAGGSITAAFWARDVVINGTFASGTRMDLNAANSVTITGTDQGLVSVSRDLNTFTAGIMNNGQLRVGNSLGGAFTANSVVRSRISVGDNIGSITVNGAVSETAFQAGADLGADGAPGGTGFNADSASTGDIGNVTINGDFTRSDVTAGLLRGPDGFFGTADDAAGAGRSFIGQVTISGTQVGSNLGSQSYRISATGSVSGVSLAGRNLVDGVTEQTNFMLKAQATVSNPLRVLSIAASEDSQIWYLTFFFNQDIDSSSVAPSLSVFEVRDSGQTLIPLVQGTDYFVIPSGFSNRAKIRFAQAVTNRDLIPTGGVPAGGASTPGTQDPTLAGPGIFRFVLSAAAFRGTNTDARLAGDPASGEVADFSDDTVIGDAGDRLTPEVVNVGTTPLPQLIDLYGAADLDIVLDNNQTPDGQPDINTFYTVRGVIGDNPDHGVNVYRVTGDVDVYKITLRAGQIIRFGAMQGSLASDITPVLVNANGFAQIFVTADSVPLPPSDPTLVGAQGQHRLIKTTGTYFIVVSNVGLPAAGTVPPPDVDPGDGSIGDYNFTVNVFDDQDTGFGAATDSGNGQPIVNAPAPIVFAGANQIFGDGDDLAEVIIGEYRFTLNVGTDQTPGTGDDTVSGGTTGGPNATLITSTRAGSSLTSVINSAIGPIGHNGVPGSITPDADVFVLNNGQPIDPGTKIKVIVKLADIGADLGTFSRFNGRDFRDDVQFGIFDITNASGVDDGTLVASPTDFKPTAQKQRAIASQGGVSYGYDQNGDYFIEFVTPGLVGGFSTQAAKYGIYLQGVFNTNYTIQVTQTEGAQAAAVPAAPQNFLIETGGGEVTWLRAGGEPVKLAPFLASVLGFTGQVSNQEVGDYILASIVTRLNSIFTTNGLNVRFSTNAADFEHQDFSRIFVTSSNDPISIFNTQNFGYSQHSDSYNLDRNDEAAIFLPSFGQLGFTPGVAGIDTFALALGSAVGRRAGELMGLRLEESDLAAVNPSSIMAANSVSLASPNAVYGTGNRALAHGGFEFQFDSTGFFTVENNFFLGQQNAFALLDKFLTP